MYLITVLIPTTAEGSAEFEAFLSSLGTLAGLGADTFGLLLLLLLGNDARLLQLTLKLLVTRVVASLTLVLKSPQ